MQVYEKKNGEYTNKSIKLNDLGMNQGIEFTPRFCETGEGKFGEWFKVKGVFHNNPDVEDVVIWATKKNFPEFEAMIDKRVKVTKVKKDGAKFHSYDVVEANASPSSLPKMKLSSSKGFEFLTDNLKDSEGTYSEKDAVAIIKQANRFDDFQAYKELWTLYGSDEARAKLVYEHRGEAQ